ncbi:MAG: type II toxin-antitoxin system HicB family antitoxin [Bacteroidetes bacterium]|jgi:predicted RNase H-like HicB family nuclease|nr:type II toxin-antitoxin system HicB family antitoxin [Bacteroidota bacterium]
MQYKIKIKKSEEGYAVWCEDLPGCASQGETEEEAMANIKDAIEEYLTVKNELVKDEKLVLIEV